MNVNIEVVKVSPIVKDVIDYSTIIFKIRFPKRVDFENSRDFWIFFNALIEGGALKLLLDLHDLEYIDSSGIGVLISTAKALRKNSGDVVLANASSDVRNVFKVVNLQSFIKLFNTDGEAFNHFRLVT
ncbi:MAG: hypothetical protein CVV44_16545 [Spirochaetae bacterium HGW-Spirochaetae-1]|jgi:anti-sigma B factor antagonist|nr:MAG: hypothetical protein CVV44_16545 [Spirochaetae bacterium HGW-Spirochaetae-1]